MDKKLGHILYNYSITFQLKLLVTPVDTELSFFQNKMYIKWSMDSFVASTKNKKILD